MKGIVRRRLEVLRRLPPGDSRALISDPNADYNAPETIMDIGCRLLIDVDQIKQEVVPLRERVRVLEQAHAPDEDPEEEVRRRQAEERIGDLKYRITEQKRQIAQLEEMFDEEQAKILSDYIVWQRETLQTESAELPRREEELEKANDALIDLMDSEAVEQEGKASMKIEELRAMLNEMRGEEADLMEEHEALLRSEPSAIEDAKIIASWQKKLQNVEHVKAYRKLEMSKLIRLQKSQIENMEASIRDKKRREDVDRARETWRKNYHIRADQERERRLKQEEENAKQRELDMQEEMERQKKAKEAALRKKKQQEEKKKREEEKKKQEEADRRARHKHRHKRRRVINQGEGEEEEEDEIGDVVKAHLTPVAAVEQSEADHEDESDKGIRVDDESEAAHIEDKMKEFDLMQRQVADMIARDQDEARAQSHESELSSSSSSTGSSDLEEPETKPPVLELGDDPDHDLSTTERPASDSSEDEKPKEEKRKSSDDEQNSSDDDDSTSSEEEHGKHKKRRRVSKVRRRVRVGKRKVRLSKEPEDLSDSEPGTSRQQENLIHFDETPVGVVERPHNPDL